MCTYVCLREGLIIKSGVYFITTLISVPAFVLGEVHSRLCKIC